MHRRQPFRQRPVSIAAHDEQSRNGQGSHDYQDKEGLRTHGQSLPIGA